MRECPLGGSLEVCWLMRRCSNIFGSNSELSVQPLTPARDAHRKKVPEACSHPFGTLAPQPPPTPPSLSFLPSEGQEWGSSLTVALCSVPFSAPVQKALSSFSPAPKLRAGNWQETFAPSNGQVKVTCQWEKKMESSRQAGRDRKNVQRFENDYTGQSLISQRITGVVLKAESGRF